MPLFAGKIEAISTIPDEELSSFDQIDLSAFHRARSKKPTYKSYNALLIHRCTLRSLKRNVDLMVEQANDALFKASENRRKTLQALAHACESTRSPHSLTCPPIAGKVLQNIIELQTFYHDERAIVLTECQVEQRRAQVLLVAVDERLTKTEQVLVKKFGIHTVDDEGNPLDMQDVERVIHVMASIPGNEGL